MENIAFVIYVMYICVCCMWTHLVMKYSCLAVVKLEFLLS